MKQHLKEAITDTVIANIINIPLNFLMVSLCFYYELTALWTTVVLTTTFTALAIIRKTFVRAHFHKKAIS